MSKNNLFVKLKAYALIGPAVGISRGLLGLLSFEALAGGLMFVVGFALLNAGFGLTVIVPTATAICTLYSVMVNFSLILKQFKDNPLICVFTLIMASVFSAAKLGITIGVTSLLCLIPPVGALVMSIVALASSSLPMAFAVGYCNSMIVHFCHDIFNIITVGFKSIFSINSDEPSEYSKGPLTAGFHAGLAAADAFGANYGTGYKNASTEKLLTTAYQSFTDKKIAFNSAGEVIEGGLKARAPG